eukprot:gene8456-biopygen8841
MRSLYDCPDSPVTSRNFPVTQVTTTPFHSGPPGRQLSGLPRQISLQVPLDANSPSSDATQRHTLQPGASAAAPASPVPISPRPPPALAGGLLPPAAVSPPAAADTTYLLPLPTLRLEELIRPLPDWEITRPLRLGEITRPPRLGEITRPLAKAAGLPPPVTDPPPRTPPRGTLSGQGLSLWFYISAVGMVPQLSSQPPLPPGFTWQGATFW